MHNPPLVSVIIPVQDENRFISHALESIYQQTYPHIEIIVVSSKPLEQFSKSRSIRWQHSKSETIPQKINEGLKISKGEYLTVLLPTDSYHPERIEVITQKMIDSKIDLVFTRVRAVDHNNHKLWPEHPFRLWYEDMMFNIINHHNLEYSFLINHLAVCMGNVVFSRKLYNQIGELNDLNSFSYDFVLRAIPFFNLNYIESELYNFRVLEPIAKQDESIDNKEEKSLIQLNYFLNVLSNKPINQNAPSLEFSPYQFCKLQDRLGFNRMLNKFIQKTTESNSEVMTSSLSIDNFPEAHKKDITLVTHDLAIGGGAPKLVLDLALELQNKGYKPNILSLANGPLKEEFKKLNLPLEIVPRRLLRWTKMLGKFKRIFLLIQMILYAHFKTSQHIIINSSASWPFALPFALFSFRKKIHWYIHESYSPMAYLHTGLAKKLLQKGIHNKIFSFWFGSISTQKIWESAVDAIGKVKYWSGFESAPSSVNPRNEIKNILAIGTSHPRKGTHYLVDAFIACVKEGKIPDDVCLVVIGLPQKIDHFNADIVLKVVLNNLQDRIKLFSCISADELIVHFKKADLFVQPSILECMPLSLLQAMAEGIPIISTDVNGCAEAIHHHKTGYQCRPFSSKALADAITEAVNNPKKTRELGENGRRYFSENFAKKITVEKILEEIGS